MESSNLTDIGDLLLFIYLSIYKQFLPRIIVNLTICYLSLFSNNRQNPR